MRFYGVVTLLLTTVFLINVECKLSVPQLKGMIAKLKGSCLKKTGASEEFLASAHEGNFIDDQNFACFQKCVFQMMNVLKNDRIQEAVLTKHINTMIEPDIAPILKDMVHECIAEASDEDDCMAALHFVRCWYHKNPEMYIFP
uniref:Odorant binding protein 3 n=1 Tax=Trissolcus japonicus TaxID=1388796 RepID=A0A7G6J4J9_9HYME|nr:odorant binding protein 3 [Trissolcus japonicus]